MQNISHSNISLLSDFIYRIHKYGGSIREFLNIDIDIFGLLPGLSQFKNLKKQVFKISGDFMATQQRSLKMTFYILQTKGHSSGLL